MSAIWSSGNIIVFSEMSPWCSDTADPIATYLWYIRNDNEGEILFGFCFRFYSKSEVM